MTSPPTTLATEFPITISPPSSSSPSPPTSPTSTSIPAAPTLSAHRKMPSESHTTPIPPMPISTSPSHPQQECRELLQDPDGTNLFRTYLKGAYACEVLNLWIDIELYKQLEDEKQQQHKGLFIYEKYCKQQGDYEVNIDECLRMAVKHAADHEEFKCNTFDDIQAQVFDLLCNDCFMGFRHTDTYMNYISKCSKGVAIHRRTRSAGSHLTDYVKKNIQFLTNRKSLSDSQRNLRTYFDNVKKSAPVKS